MSAHPCCIRVIPYESEGDSNKFITMCLYVSTNDMGIPGKVRDDAKKKFINYKIEFDDLQKRPPGKIFIPLASSQKQKDKELSDLSRKIEENLHLFDNRLNVTAVQASYKVVDSKEQPEICVAVFVLGKARVPAGESDITEIKKIKNEDNKCVFKDDEFDVLEGYYQPAIDALQASYVSPLQSGFGIGVEGTDGAGTLGGFLEDENGKHYILSCQHVLHPRDAQSNVILQPAQSDYKTMIEKAKKELATVSEKKKTQENEQVMQRKVTKAQKKLDDIESEKPREIGKYVDGLQKNESIKLGERNLQFFVDAAIADLCEIEENNLKSMSQGCSGLYGYHEIENSKLPNGNIVELENLDRELSTVDKLKFNKFGRTTAFTKYGSIDSSFEMFIKMYDPKLPPLKNVPLKFCKDCKLSGDNLEEEIDHKKMEKEITTCIKCKKKLEESDLFETFWARNCLAIRRRKYVFCDHGDSGSLVFDDSGKTWGLLYGSFDHQSFDAFYALASPLCVTLKALENKSGKRGLKLWLKPRNSEDMVN